MAGWCNGSITVSSAVDNGSTPLPATNRKEDTHWTTVQHAGKRKDYIYSRKISIYVRS